MKKQSLFLVLAGLSFLFTLSGCTVRSYPLTRDRVDQDLTGNRGYIQGEAPAEEGIERKSTRTTQVVEIELRSPFKFEKMSKQKLEKSSMIEGEEAAEGNRGYVDSSAQAQILESGAMEKYTVQKNDTLQKISKKFYGTTKQWTKIYDANKDTLKGPNKIYPGQVINVPVKGAGLSVPNQNLK